MQSESVSKLIPALIAAKQQIGPVLKTKVNPAFRSKYADLDTVCDVTEGPLAANGLVVVQTTRVDPERGPLLVTTLYHESGEWLAGEYPLQPVKHDPQGLGGAMTYARRYALLALLGLAPEDDDGETASGRGPGHQQQHNGNGNGNGHNRPAPAPAMRPGGTDAPPAGHNGTPRSGKGLFAWIKEQEQKTGIPLLRDINEWAKRQGYTGRMVDWNADTVDSAVVAAKHILYGDFEREPGED